MPALTSGIGELLPASAGDPDAPVAGRVFKIERNANGERVAYVRMFAGTVGVRDRLRFGPDREDKVTALSAFERGGAAQRSSVSAGEIAVLCGLDAIRVGDRIGARDAESAEHHFAPPTLESVVVADNPADRAKLRAALGQLTEQDPLIDVRQDDALGETSVSLYGEVQKEVVQATLLREYGVEVTFRDTTMIHVERPAGVGRAVELLGAESNPHAATLGLCVEPAPPGSGLELRLEAAFRSLPLYVYKTVENFVELMTQYVRDALREGVHGWRVTDCVVTMDQCGYVSPTTTAADYRKLTPQVLTSALRRAGTVVCEPMVRAAVEVPSDAVGTTLAAITRFGGVVTTPTLSGDLTVLRTTLPAARAQELQRQLAGLTSGEGVAETTFAGYQPVQGVPPARRRTS